MSDEKQLVLRAFIVGFGLGFAIAILFVLFTLEG